MTVGELIKYLSDFNTNDLVRVEDIYEGDYSPKKIYQHHYEDSVVIIFCAQSNIEEDEE